MNKSFVPPFMLSLGLCLTMAGLATSGLFLGGCTDARTEQMEKAATGLAQTSTKITELKVGVNKLNSTLQKLQSGTDFATNYAVLKEQMATVKSNVAFLKSKSEEMTNNKNTIIATWRQEIGDVKDPTLKASAADRSAKVATTFGDINTNVSAAKEAYQPYIASLDEVVKFLDKDQTPSGIKVAAPVLDKAAKSGVDVQVQLHLLSAKLDALSGEISPNMK